MTLIFMAGLKVRTKLKALFPQLKNRAIEIALFRKQSAGSRNRTTETRIAYPLHKYLHTLPEAANALVGPSGA